MNRILFTRVFRRVFALCLTLVFALSFTGCAKKKLSGITYFSYTGNDGSYMGADYEYTAVSDQEHTQITVKQSGSETYTLTAPAGFMAELEAIVNEYNMISYDGFDKADKRIFDGRSFDLCIMTSGGDEVSASGYMKYPKNFTPAMQKITELFKEAYYDAYPDPERALKNCFEDTLGGSLEDIDISYRYISSEHEGEKGYYTREAPSLRTGAQSYRILDLDGDGADEMIVSVITEKDGIYKLCFEIYEYSEQDGAVKAAGSVLDADMFSNDGIYFNVLLSDHKGIPQIVYSSQKTFLDGYGYDEYSMRICKYDGSGIIFAADESFIIESGEKDSVTADDIAAFIKAAEENSLDGSLAYWNEKPWDPVVKEISKGFSTGITSSSVSDITAFNDALLSAPAGEPAGDYCVSGNIFAG